MIGDGKMVPYVMRRLAKSNLVAVYCVGGVDNDLGTGKSQGPEVIAELIRTAKPGCTSLPRQD
jgi:hypothetical protein